MCSIPCFSLLAEKNNVYRGLEVYRMRFTEGPCKCSLPNQSKFANTLIFPLKWSQWGLINEFKSNLQREESRKFCFLHRNLQLPFFSKHSRSHCLPRDIPIQDTTKVCKALWYLFTNYYLYSNKTILSRVKPTIESWLTLSEKFDWHLG